MMPRRGWGRLLGEFSTRIASLNDPSWVRGAGVADGRAKIMAGRLRALIFCQIALVALIGASARAPLHLAEPLLGWAESAGALAVFPALLGFPIAAYRVARRAGLAEWEGWTSLGIEAGLLYATFLAMLPMVQ